MKSSKWNQSQTKRIPPRTRPLLIANTERNLQNAAMLTQIYLIKGSFAPQSNNFLIFTVANPSEKTNPLRWAPTCFLFKFFIRNLFVPGLSNLCSEFSILCSVISNLCSEFNLCSGLYKFCSVLIEPHVKFTSHFLAFPGTLKYTLAEI